MAKHIELLQKKKICNIFFLHQSNYFYFKNELYYKSCYDFIYLMLKCDSQCQMQQHFQTGNADVLNGIRKLNVRAKITNVAFKNDYSQFKTTEMSNNKRRLYTF